MWYLLIHFSKNTTSYQKLNLGYPSTESRVWRLNSVPPDNCYGNLFRSITHIKCGKKKPLNKPRPLTRTLLVLNLKITIGSTFVTRTPVLNVEKCLSSWWQGKSKKRNVPKWGNNLKTNKNNTFRLELKVYGDIPYRDIRQSACNNSTPTGWIVLEFHVWHFY